MIGNRFSNMKIQNRQGQVLLIAIMLLATVITVVMTVAFNSTSETQVARLEVDSQKALAAAQAGIDAAIKQSVNTPISIGLLGGTGGAGDFSSQGITGNAQVNTVSGKTFVTPLLQKDEQYTFYLSDYTSVPRFQSKWGGNLDIYLVSENGLCPSIGITIIKSDNSLEQYAYNTCAPTITNATSADPVSPKQIDDATFQRKIPTLTIANDDKIAFIKVLGGRTKLGFEGNVALPIQGKTVDSEARTASGVVKRVQLFQSFPQIPSNFFMTSF